MASVEKKKPPVAERKPHEVSIHGKTVRLRFIPSNALAPLAPPR